MGLHVAPRTTTGQSLALLFALLAIAFWFGEQGLRISGLVFPAFHWAWCAVPAAIAILLTPQDPARELERRDVWITVVVLGLGIPLVAVYDESRAPLSPLVATVERVSEGEAGNQQIRLDCLRLGREALRRLVGRPRDIRLQAPAVLLVPESGVYEFGLEADDHASLVVGTHSLFHESAAGRTRLQLEAGLHPLLLSYQQTTGEGFLHLTWGTPGLLGLLPLENHLLASPEVLSADDLTRQRHHVTIGLLVILSWTALSSLLLFRLGESRVAIVREAALWWRAPRDTALVRPLFWAACGVACLLAAYTVEEGLPRTARLARVLYASEPGRIPLAVARHEAYVLFLRILTLGCGGVACVFLVPATLRERAWSPSRVRILALLGVGSGAALVGGAVLSHRYWEGLGRPCWDWYCLYAAHIRDVLRAPGAASWSALRAHLDANFHANSPMGPLLTAITGLVVVDIPTAYRLVSEAATLATIPVLHRLAHHHLGLDRVASGVAVLLFVSTSQVQRSLLFTQTDPLVMLFVSAAFERLLTLQAHFSAAAMLSVILLTTIALLTKLSALPLVAVIGIVTLASGAAGTTSWRRRSLIAGGMAIAPLVAFAGFMWAAGTLPNYAIELGRRATADSRPWLHVIAAVSTLFPLALGLGLNPRRLEPREGPFVVMIVLYLAGLWGSRASGWERFYLVLLPIALPLAVKRLAELPGLRRPLDVAVLLTFFALAHALRLVINVYY